MNFFSFSIVSSDFLNNASLCFFSNFFHFRSWQCMIDKFCNCVHIVRTICCMIFRKTNLSAGPTKSLDENFGSVVFPLLHKF